MAFIGNTEKQTQEMLRAVGVEAISDLFDEIPKDLFFRKGLTLPNAMTEYELNRMMAERGEKTKPRLNFIGAGAYQHHIPAAVWEIAGRGEFLTAYTPYQAEASQGSLQLIYEFQTMIARLTGMEVANASLYDGATALAEAALMAVRLAKGKRRTVAVPQNIHPRYREVVDTYAAAQNIHILPIAFDESTGVIDKKQLEAVTWDDIAAFVVGQPNFFGGIESVDDITEVAQKNGALVIGLCNPLSLGMLKPPGEWGDRGADICCGEGQPLGVPLAYGGPYFGFFACQSPYVRQMPGRVVGRTTDASGNEGFVLTLQAREQHIRRAKATSNICTNQGLLVTAASIYLSLMGGEGLRATAETCHTNLHTLIEKLIDQKRLKIHFSGPCFHEVVLKFPQATSTVLAHFEANDIDVGYSLESDYPELSNCILCCLTELKTDADIDRFVEVVGSLPKVGG